MYIRIWILNHFSWWQKIFFWWLLHDNIHNIFIFKVSDLVFGLKYFKSPAWCVCNSVAVLIASDKQQVPCGNITRKRLYFFFLSSGDVLFFFLNKKFLLMLLKKYGDNINRYSYHPKCLIFKSVAFLLRFLIQKRDEYVYIYMVDVVLHNFCDPIDMTEISRCTYLFNIDLFF